MTSFDVDGILTVKTLLESLNQRAAFLIEKVIYNPPATIVIWKDGTKTVVKCDENDTFDQRTGLLLCIAKKAYYGGKYNNVLRKWSEEPNANKLRWISVKEALPENGKYVICRTSANNSVYDLEYWDGFNCGRWYRDAEFKSVTHWMYRDDLLNL